MVIWCRTRAASVLGALRRVEYITDNGRGDNFGAFHDQQHCTRVNERPSEIAGQEIDLAQSGATGQHTGLLKQDAELVSPCRPTGTYLSVSPMHEDRRCCVHGTTWRSRTTSAHLGRHPDDHRVCERFRYFFDHGHTRIPSVDAGWRIDHSEAGLYLWATHPEHDCWSAAELLAAQCGILVAPGELYGPAGVRHVRVALTATDERITAAADHLRTLPERLRTLSPPRRA